MYCLTTWNWRPDASCSPLPVEISCGSRSCGWTIWLAIWLNLHLRPYLQYPCCANAQQGCFSFFLLSSLSPERGPCWLALKTCSSVSMSSSHNLVLWIKVSRNLSSESALSAHFRISLGRNLLVLISSSFMLGFPSGISDIL